MSTFRQFRIINDVGQGYSLNGDSGIFFHEPTGLGLKNEILTADLGYGFFHDLQNKKIPTDPIAGDLLFINDNPYRLYREFVSFLVGSKKLIMAYKPYGSDEFFCRGRFEYLTKEELEETGILRVPISFVPFTPWYLPKESNLSLRPLSGGEMAYEFDYDQNLVYASPLVGSYSVQLDPDGHMDAALVFSYPGYIEDPVLVLKGANSNAEYGRCEVDANSTGFNYSSLYSDSYIKDNSGNSLLNGVSPGYSPFFRLPLTEPCILTLTAASTLTANASVDVYYFYRSV